MKKLSSFLFGAVLVVAITGCASTTADKLPSAAAVMEAKNGSSVSGTVDFTELNDGEILVRVNLDGVPPGVHGFHVHENGDCSANDGTSAGGHFNPDAKQHGGPHATSHHAGDLGNVTANDSGEVRTEMVTSSITLDGGSHSVIGRAVILHAKPDDLTSQPTGNAGGRIACGVIVGAK